MEGGSSASGPETLWPSACQVKGDGGSKKPMGSADDTDRWDLSWTNPSNPSDGIKMTFGGGADNGADSCHSTYSRKVEISFQCGDGLGEPVFNTETDDCLYKFDWITDIVCWDDKKKSHAKENGDGGGDGGGGGGGGNAEAAVELFCNLQDEDSGVNLNLSPLSTSQRNYMANFVDGDDTYVYHINVCRTLIETDTQKFTDECGGNTGICQTKVGDSKFYKSLGKPASPQWDADAGLMYLEYTGGTKCSEGQLKCTPVRKPPPVYPPECAQSSKIPC